MSVVCALVIVSMVVPSDRHKLIVPKMKKMSTAIFTCFQTKCHVSNDGEAALRQPARGERGKSAESAKIKCHSRRLLLGKAMQRAGAEHQVHGVNADDRPVT